MKATIMTNLMRPFTLADAQEVTDLFNACSQAIYSCNEFELDSLINEWTTPGLNLEEMVRVLINEYGDIIGYVEVWDTTNPHVNKYVWGLMHPVYWDDDQYHEMLAWAEVCARKRITLAPEGARVVLSQGIPNQDIRRKKALETYGFEVVRHFFRMEIELQNAPQSPVVPEGIAIMPINVKTELKAALLAMDDGFKDHWGHVDRPIDEVLDQWQHLLQNDRDFDPSLWFLAKSGDQIAGVCRCAAKTVEDPDMGWVNQLCVRKPWRHQGLGKALLLMAFNDFYHRGKQRAGLVVDAASLTNATRLYEKAGMHVTRQYDTYEKELRPGKNLATES
jgi:ribosomal protein S18 acetylase RimI-like enzyme